MVEMVWIVERMKLSGLGDYGNMRYIMEMEDVIGIVDEGKKMVIIVGGIEIQVGEVMKVKEIMMKVI